MTAGPLRISVAVTAPQGSFPKAALRAVPAAFPFPASAQPVTSRDGSTTSCRCPAPQGWPPGPGASGPPAASPPVGGHGRHGSAPSCPRGAAPSAERPAEPGGGSMGLELYLDLLSQPCRSIYIFARTNNIPFEFKHVELFKGEEGWQGGRRGRASEPRAQRSSLGSRQTRCWERSRRRRRRAARSGPAQVSCRRRCSCGPRDRAVPGWRRPGR